MELTEIKLEPIKTKNPKTNSYTDDLKELSTFATENKLNLVLRMPDEVQVDIDSPVLPENFSDRMAMVNEVQEIRDYHIERSRGGNLHLTIRFKHAVAPFDALLFESVLDGDFKRVMLGRKALARDGDFLSVFFRVPGAEVLFDGPYTQPGKETHVEADEQERIKI